MEKYSKLIGTIVGALLGFGVSYGFLPADFNTIEVVAAITILTSTIGTYFAPKNAT